MQREQFQSLIEKNIKEAGYHVTIVQSGTCPRFAYSIGLLASKGFELIFAGGVYFMADEALAIINEVAKNVSGGETKNLEIKLDKWGTFYLSEIDVSWSGLMMLGVFDFYKINQVKAYQIIPTVSLFTNDIPKMSKPFSEEDEPIWKWLKKKWDLPVPESSQVATDLKALRGESIMEIMRWEEDYWEMYTEEPSEFNKSGHRIVPLGTILGLDKSLQSAISLEIGKGIWRDPTELIWNKWG